MAKHVQNKKDGQKLLVGKSHTSSACTKQHWIEKIICWNQLQMTILKAI
jgi:hypothetical protein